jgi:hypothetical protein
MIRKKRVAIVAKVAELDPGCYGKYSAAKEDCLKCGCLQWCKDSRDPSQLTYESFDKAIATPAEEENKFEHFDRPDEEQKYTSTQVCFVIHKLLTMDESTFRILKFKILSPSATDEQIGKAFRITRQAVSKQFKAYSSQFPQFKRLLNPSAKILTTDAERCLKEANNSMSECLKIINRRNVK